PLLYELRSSWEDAAVSSGLTTEGSLRYRASRALETQVLRRADAVVVICRGLQADALARGVSADRLTVVGNAVDADSFARSPARHSLRTELGLDGKYVLGFLGSFFQWEGLALLIEALPQILEARPDVRVLLVGSGPEEAALRAAVDRLGLHDHVVFAGSRPHAEVGAVYEAVDILVYPRVPMRLTEMVTPLKPLEAMALGKVFVASDVGGHRELVRDGSTGVLFRAGDVRALAQAVVATAADPELQRRLREAGPRFVREERTWAGEVARYEPVYRSLMRAGVQGRAVQGRG
ncbi:MAG TPA: glycosyltransferase, partial [Steroidobacteraceae bacterium]